MSTSGSNGSGQQGRMQGMDTEHARQVSQSMGQQAGQIAGVVSRISSVIGALNWEGPDKRAFSADWDGSFAPEANQASESLDEQSRVLAHHADRQDQASS